MIMMTICSLVSGKMWAAPSVSLTKAQDMDYSNLEFTALPGTASLGTDGTIAYTGSLSGAGAGTAGQFTLSGKGGATVADLSCSTSLTLCDASSNAVNVTGTELAVTSAIGGVWLWYRLCRGWKRYFA